jgi:hypothetical protein
MKPMPATAWTDCCHVVFVTFWGSKPAVRSIHGSTWLAHLLDGVEFELVVFAVVPRRHILEFMSGVFIFAWTNRDDLASLGTREVRRPVVGRAVGHD